MYTMSTLLNMLIAHFYGDHSISNLCDEEENIKNEQNAGERMTKMTDEKEG